MKATKWNVENPVALVFGSNLAICLAGSMACLAQGPPVINEQPQSQTVLQGSNVTFTVTVSSVTYLTYQWRFDGNNLSGATNSALTLIGVQSSQAGNYSVAASNSVGYAISSNALLTVLTSGTMQFSLPAYLVPENAGEALITVTRSGGGTGPASVTYATADGSAVDGVDYFGTSGTVSWADGETTPKGFMVAIIDDTTHQGDRYFLVNLTLPTGASLGSPNSATVTIVDDEVPAAITNQPVSVTKTQTGTAVFSVGAVGSAPLNYQWRFHATNDLPDATNATLQLVNVQAWQSGDYSVLVSNAYGSALSSNAVLNVALPTGTVACWGDNAIGQSTLPGDAIGVYQAIAAGAFHSLALRTNGTVLSWGDNNFGQTNVPDGLTNVTAIAAGFAHSLALVDDGTIVAWGDNTFGQTNVPPGLSNVTSIAAGAYHSLALQGDGTVLAWGSDSDGQVEVPFGLSNVVSVAAGYYHNLALTATGVIVGWGANSTGESEAPIGQGTIAALACGNGFSLALEANGTVVAWGDNTFSQTNVPPGLDNVVAIAAGAYHALALRTNGMVFGWGSNSHGQISEPFDVATMVAISAGSYHSMGLKGSGAPYITVQPRSQRLSQGSTAGFFIMAAATTTSLSYQWRLNGVNLAGGTSSAFVRTNVQLADMGVYSVLISNSLGIATSANATLSLVGVVLVIKADGFSVNGFQIGARGPPGDYVLEASSDFLGWVPIATNSASNGTAEFLDQDAFNFVRRFYRVRLE